MRKIFTLLVLGIVSFSAIADSREEKIKDLMEAQGLLAMFEDQMAMGKVQGEKVGKQMLDQVLSQINPNEEFQSRFTAAFNNYIGKVQSPWGAEEIVNVWSQYYGQQFTEQELNELLKFYTSPIGKKEVIASKFALTEFTVHFQKLGEPIFQQATQEYIQELKLVAKECNCKK